MPATEALKVAANLSYNNDEHINKRPPVSKKIFIELGKLALNDVVMLTTDEYYVQTKDLAMGSPLSPLFANAWLTRVDSKFKKLDTRFYSRYVFSGKTFFTILFGFCVQTFLLQLGFLFIYFFVSC